MPGQSQPAADCRESKVGELDRGCRIRGAPPASTAHTAAWIFLAEGIDAVADPFRWKADRGVAEGRRVDVVFSDDGGGAGVWQTGAQREVLGKLSDHVRARGIL